MTFARTVAVLLLFAQVPTSHATAAPPSSIEFAVLSGRLYELERQVERHERRINELQQIAANMQTQRSAFYGTHHE